MVEVTNVHKNLVLYVDQHDSYGGLEWDDIIAQPISQLPEVMINPKKSVVIERKKDDKLPSLYDGIFSPNSNQGNEVADDDSDIYGSDYVVEDSGNDLSTDDELWPENEKEVVGEEDGSSGDSDVELDFPDSSDEEGNKRIGHKVFVLEEDNKNPFFKVGTMFATVQGLRKAIGEYSCKNRVDIKMPRNDKTRINAHCATGCPWEMYAYLDSRTKCFVVKKYVGQHNCRKEWHLKRFTSKFLADKYMETFKADDKMSLRNFTRIVQKDWNMAPTRTKLWRAKSYAMKAFHGDEVQQYNLLWDYAAEVRRSNPGSTLFLNLHNGCFSTLYFCLYPCKVGFPSAYRPLICLDGCHIETKFGGQLLTAIGTDPNDCIYPVAMAVVEVESKCTWKWFLQTLKADLGISNTSPWTIMSDKQKGLIQAVQDVFADSEHRFCVRHLYSNFQGSHKGEILKNQLWACARSSSVPEWNDNMEKMKILSQDAYEYVEKLPPNTWVHLGS